MLLVWLYKDFSRKCKEHINYQRKHSYELLTSKIRREANINNAKTNIPQQCDLVPVESIRPKPVNTNTEHRTGAFVLFYSLIVRRQAQPP